uniref:X-box-binding protein 1 n=1 Tax=Timema shepardi TaxID=629360 RepID=A0A7R9G319_TIMSH|nr:unnamed protein product [Timema shepardi]
MTLVLTDSSQLTSDSQHLAAVTSDSQNLGIYSSLTTYLVLTDSSQLTADGFEKLPDQIMKLKNRVAAQCSRDRKKARLDELEIEVKLLKEMNDALLAHCDELKMKSEELEMKNKELTTENKHLCSKLSSRQTRDVGCSPIVGPAASIVHPPPQGLGLQPAQGLTLAVWRILTICLLFPTSWETLLQTITCPSWRNSQSLFFEKLLQAAACRNAESAETPQVLGGAPEDMGPSPMACDYLAATNSCHQELLPTIHIPDTRETFRGACEPLIDDVNETITITLPCEGIVCVEDAVQEVVTSESCEVFEEAVSPLFRDTHSPIPHSPLLYTIDDIAVKKGATFSDCGYESLDSPYSEDSTNCGLTDLWNESFSDLFPSLI